MAFGTSSRERVTVTVAEDMSMTTALCGVGGTAVRHRAGTSALYQATRLRRLEHVE